MSAEATSVTEKLIPVKPRWSGQVGAGGVADGTTQTIPLASTTDLDNGDIYIFTVNRVDANTVKQDTWETGIGELSGSNLINCVRRVEGNATASTSWAAGTVVEILFTAKHWNNMIDFLGVEHNSDGTHSAITADSLELASGATVTAILDEDDMATDSATAVPTQQSVKAYVDTEVGAIGTSWIEAGETWVYASADDPTFTFTVAGVDLTSKYSAGMRIKLTQTTVKYFIITAVAFSTNTTITVYGGTDYDLANAAITSPYYSTQKAPQGFPLSPIKWTQTYSDSSDRAQATPTADTWYNINTASLSIPIGVWNVDYFVLLDVSDTSVTSVNVEATLSTANDSQSDINMNSFGQILVGSATLAYFVQAARSKYVALTSKTTHYLNTKTRATGITEISNRGDVSGTVIRAVSAYL